jgi:hypothetical protein
MRSEEVGLPAREWIAWILAVYGLIAFAFTVYANWVVIANFALAPAPWVAWISLSGILSTVASLVMSTRGSTVLSGPARLSGVTLFGVACLIVLLVAVRVAH